ncbi:GntR family transcriptional regulator, partial [Schnuerera sp.]|uniref:GntR family transcriptional regulator n=1 Tax=Schnuerera sp. TaxID=2794844 RepID=UPI002C8CE640
MYGDERYRKKSLSDIVIDYITKKILTGEYKEGDRILESKIAESLEISRAPVREGIIELQNQGLLKYIPRKGNFVTKMTMEDVKEVFDIRLLL